MEIDIRIHIYISPKMINNIFSLSNICFVSVKNVSLRPFFYTHKHRTRSQGFGTYRIDEPSDGSNESA